MKLAMITAGGAGMFCGSCMQDNTLVRTLRSSAVDALLVPTYTPIRVDEENVSGNRVFLGGINVYLDSVVPGWNRLPWRFTSLLNRPSVIQWFTRFGSHTDASRLGALTLDLLRGSSGPQHREIAELVRFISEDLRPDVVLFSNALLSGILPALRQKFSGTILTLLQGDDIFLEALPARYKADAVALVSRNCQQVNGLLTHSQYYAQFMSSYLALPVDRFRRIPLTVDTTLTPESGMDIAARPHSATNPAADVGTTVRIGYFARICPEKGVHRLLDAAAAVLPERPQLEFTIAGYLPEQNRRQFFNHLQRIQRQSGGQQLRWAGSPSSREEKFQLLRSFDLLCVPTEYREPKGLYVLEAALCGVSSVVPNHGAFPERIAELGAGCLYSPDIRGDLERVLLEFCDSSATADPRREQVRRQLRQRVVDVHSMESTGPRLVQTIQELMRSK